MKPYQPATNLEVATSWGPKLATVCLRDVVMFCLHDLNLKDSGIYNKRNVHGSNTWSLHAAGRAWDCDVRSAPDPYKAGDFVAQLMTDKADLIGVCEVIWNKQRTTTAGKKPYHGSDPHTSHPHIGQTRDFVNQKHTRDEWIRWYSNILFGK